MSYTNLKLFALSSNQELAAKVADKIGIELGRSSVREFSDGEIQVNIEESIRGHHVFILQSTSSPVNDNLMEILIMVDALKRASAETINVVFPSTLPMIFITSEVFILSTLRRLSMIAIGVFKH